MYRDHHTLMYDYLVIALGSETNFFGMSDSEQFAFTMKTIDDAIVLINHVINILEQATLDEFNKVLRKSLFTFVLFGGGFSGVETVGALNDFVRDTVRTIKKYLHNGYKNNTC
jgi:NADH:ubiquinone reductase (H+-translocating)